jgi:hypothetical protein
LFIIQTDAALAFAMIAEGDADGHARHHHRGRDGLM